MMLHFSRFMAMHSSLDHGVDLLRESVRENHVAVHRSSFSDYVQSN